MAAKRQNLDPKDLQVSPHIVYWRHLDRISKAKAAGQDDGPLIHQLWALLAHLQDAEFHQEWEALHSFDIGEHQTEEDLSIEELRTYELASLVKLMARRNMLEEARARGYV